MQPGNRQFFLQDQQKANTKPREELRVQTSPAAKCRWTQISLNV